MSIFRKQDRRNWSLGSSVYYTGSSIADIEKKIAAGGDVNATFSDNYTHRPIIWWAAVRGRSDVVRLLLAKGADPNAGENSGYVPLMTAIEKRDIEMAKALLDAGAHVNNQKDGETPLILAARQGCGEIVKLLVEKGADVNAQLRDGNTALHLAAVHGYANLALYLVEKGANVAMTNGNLNTAADVAEKEYPGLAALIRGKAQPDTSKPLAVDTGWRLLAADEIAHVTVKEPVGYRITEIFNFTARTYAHIACNLESRAESQSIKSFSELESGALLDKAHAELIRLGGCAERGPAGTKRLPAPGS
jgi:hypothetical protein